MKKTFKTTALIFAGLAVTIGLMISSCAKDGKTGPAGAPGAPGAAGVNGNANVQQYDFGSMTLNASTAAVYSNADITAGILDSSVIIVYYSGDGAQWNVAGGCGPVCQYQTIMYTNPAGPSVNVYLENTDGSGYSGGDVTWPKSRVLIVKANVFRMAHTKDGVDFKNYENVKNYFKLSKF